MTSQKFNLILTSKLKVMKPSDLKVVVNNTKKDDQDKQDHYFVGGVMQEHRQLLEPSPTAALRPFRP